MHSPDFINFGGPEAIARQILGEINSGNNASAAESAVLFAARFGKAFAHANVLCAIALEKAGQPLLALDYWDQLVRNYPHKLEWLQTALKLAWAHEKNLSPELRDNVDAWIDLLKHVFISVPNPELLFQLHKRGWQCKGCVGAHKGRLKGWLWLKRDEKVFLNIEPKGLSLNFSLKKKVEFENRVLYETDTPLPHQNAIISLSVISGGHINGSPVACSPAHAPANRKSRLAQKKITIIIPVYYDRKSTLSCLGSIFASRKKNSLPFEILVMWDHGPDAKLLESLRKLARKNKLVLRETPVNMGFLGCVNQAISLVPSGDIILLNSDTLVHGNWVDRLWAAAQTRDAATITALGSEAEHVSFPAYYDRGKVADLHATAILDKAAASMDPSDAMREIPVGCGFCMLLSRRALDLVGSLDGLWLCKGYGEEVDFCLRSREMGLKHYAAANVFVAHLGGKSFGQAKLALAAQNNAAIFDKFPEYRQDYDQFLYADPLKSIREKISRKLLSALEVGELRLRHWTDQFLPFHDIEYNKLEKNKNEESCPHALFFIRPLADKIDIMLRARAQIPVADTFFSLPADQCELWAIIEAWLKHGPTILDDNNLAKALAAYLPIPACQERTDPVSEPPDMPELPPEGGQAWLLAPPRSLQAWSRAMEYGKQHCRTKFYCPGLDKIWPGIPHPANIINLPRMASLRAIVPQGLIFCERENDYAAWSAWLKAQGCSSIPFNRLVGNEI